MSWFSRKPKTPSREVVEARQAVADADLRLVEARDTARVSRTVRMSLQELRAQDHFTSTIIPGRNN